MKKLFAIATALVLFASTSGLVFAQGTTAASATPTAKKVMKHKTHKKKVKKTVTPVASPVSK
jgi:hypothetical protein